MDTDMEYVLAALVGYLLGSIPFAAIVAARHDVDLRRTGDGTPGAWNALEQLGARRAWPAFAGDGAKGLAAGLAGHCLGGWGGAYPRGGGPLGGGAWRAMPSAAGGSRTPAWPPPWSGTRCRSSPTSRAARRS